MIYYIFKNSIFTIFLSLDFLTSVHFESKIFDYIGGGVHKFRHYELNQSKTFAFQAKSKTLNNNFIVFLKNKKYHFNLVFNNKYIQKSIEIRRAKKCNVFKIKKETKSYQLFECPKSFFIVNKTNKPLLVNEKYINQKGYVSKVPIFINQKLIYVNGRTL